MSLYSSNLAVSRQLENAAFSIESFPILADILCNFLKNLGSMQIVPAQLAEMIESDPTLTFLFLKLMQKQSLRPNDDFSVLGVLDKITLKQIRDNLIFSKVLQSTNEYQQQNVVFARELQKHALLTACLTEEIVFQTSASINFKHAYFAGLFHNIGNLAINEQMPKSFIELVEQAKSENKSLCEVQQEHFTIDYPVIGKRMMQRFHFPEPVIIGIWLHTLDTVTIGKSIPEAKIAQVVQLADLISRQTGFGNSYNFDNPQISEELLLSLNITSEKIEPIKEKMIQKANSRLKLLGLDSDLKKDYASTMKETAAVLAADNTRLTGELLKAQSMKIESEFAADLIAEISAEKTASQIAALIGFCWQKHFHTGPISIYYLNSDNSIDITMCENQSNVQHQNIESLDNITVIPQQINNSFAIIEAKEIGNWFFELLPSELQKHKSRAFPLIADGSAIGVVVFETKYPVSNEKLAEMFRRPAALSGAILSLSLNGTYSRLFTESLLQAFKPSFKKIPAVPAVPQPIEKPEMEIKEEKPSSENPNNLLNALSEMAGGAAHELNNPLVVISGRAQLLDAGETDPDKKRLLKQITENASDLASIIDDLMAFAMPQEPIPSDTDIAQIIEEAAALAMQKTNVNNINLQQQISPNGPKVFADSGQIVSAIANIIANSVESYEHKEGPIKITAEMTENRQIILKIADLGCGMDEQTLRNAMNPFFSAKQAGRKRGMGLAHANRLIRLNGGTLNLESKLNEGTTVIITLAASS